MNIVLRKSTLEDFNDIIALVRSSFGIRPDTIKNLAGRYILAIDTETGHAVGMTGMYICHRVH